MPQLNLFDYEPSPGSRSPLARDLGTLAGQGIYFGASSWKYPGWLGSIYSQSRYTVRGKFSHRRFEEECLAEYAETFPVVCGDFSFYQFPTSGYWRRLFESAPRTLRFAFKVPEEITVAMWPKHTRYGTRAGRENASFLDARMFSELFCRPLSPYRDRVAALIFEFGAFPRKMFDPPSRFGERLDPFLEQLTPEFPYAIEVRNQEFLADDYFATLARHNVAHAFNAWTRMPTLADQASLPNAFTANFVVARALLRHGRAYEDAVKLFQPYEHIQETDVPSRIGLRSIADTARETRKSAYLFVNNRLEGYAPGTIAAVAESLLS
jgi:uncharacterized protein YecE (DUF72 family)